MNKEEIVTSAVMSLVCILVLVGFTVAWYSRNDTSATTTNMQLEAGENSDIIIALESGGEDISVLAANDIQGDEYAAIGLEEFSNMEEGKLAPGTYGTVTFYVTPTNKEISACSVVPSIGIAMEDEITAENLYEIAQRHIVFFADEAMTQQLDTDNPLLVTWTEADMAAENVVEKTVTVYWKWYYEYPFSEEESAELEEAEKKAKIRAYDDEDMLLGNHVSDMKFYFAFTAQ